MAWSVRFKMFYNIDPKGLLMQSPNGKESPAARVSISRDINSAFAQQHQKRRKRRKFSGVGGVWERESWTQLKRLKSCKNALTIRPRQIANGSWQDPCSQASKDLLFRSCFLSCSLKEKSVGGGWWLLWRRRRQRQRQRRHVWDKKWASEWMGIRDERPTNNCSKDRFAWIKSLDWSVWKLLKGRPVGLYTIVSLNGRFQYQRSTVWIQSRAKKIILNICLLSTVYWKDENKGKEAGDGPFF